MVTAVINLDFVPLFFFFFLYSALEIFISRTMEDYRYRLIEIEEEFAGEELEEDEFDEDEEEEEEDYEDDREREQNLIPEAVAVPVHLGIFQTGELDDGDDEEYEEDSEEEEEEEFFPPPVVRMLDRDLNNNNNINNNNLIEDDDYEDEDYEDEDEDEEDYEDEEEDYEEEEELEELFPAVMTSPRVSRSVVHGGVLLGGIVVNDDGDDDNGVAEELSGGSELCEGKFGNGDKCGGEFHGSFCPICFEAWTSGGEHQICCLPCGHIYGLSCIKKWLQQSPNSGKCPQCNNICTLKDVRVLYASRLCVADEELQKRVRSLEAKCAYLERKAGQLTPDQLVDQICSNPAAVQRLATVLAGLTQQPASP